MTLNSVIFHTNRLSELRDFYEGILELPTGTYIKNNETVPDYSDSYVNYHLDGAMLCFEEEADRTDLGTVVINVKEFSVLLKKLKTKGVQIAKESEKFFVIKDPEGRTLIFEPKR